MDFLLGALGWLGAAALLYGYAMVSSGKMSGDGAPYQVINLFGSVSLMINSGYNAAWPSAALNLVWAGIGVVALLKLYRLGVAP
ncbi:CBU_0592 family membrane protein [Nonomuraea typhae]|uniref:CBU_0592 family membrane protein n=1 Tax=Nonomuraea typhae TaxID=2603600 RepID=UPI0012F8EAF0|nr:hypothetical protein [Nonomuraea typhae]